MNQPLPFRTPHFNGDRGTYKAELARFIAQLKSHPVYKALSDEMKHELNSWGNKNEVVNADRVKDLENAWTMAKAIHSDPILKPGRRMPPKGGNSDPADLTRANLSGLFGGTAKLRQRRG